jgi:hypothetical protein
MKTTNPGMKMNTTTIEGRYQGQFWKNASEKQSETS